ncbi:MAG: ABC transporter permease [Anaerolineae bacterium]|nr:ABC transporter permease [Anaerolineae bacterium]
MTTTSPTTPAPALRQGDWVGFVLNRFIWFVLVGTFILFTLAIPNYLAPSNLANILITASVPGVLVIGQTLCLMSRRIDLSAEGTVSLVVVLAAWLMLPYRAMDLAQAGGIGWELSPFIVIPFILAVGAFVGFLNGFMIMRLKMNFFIVTLAMQLVLRGIGFVISEGAIMPGTPRDFNFLGGGRVAGVPVAPVVMFVLYVLFAFIMSRTRFGRQVTAVGANEDAARAAGFSSVRTVIIVYTVSGFMAALAGWMLLGKLEASIPNLGVGLTLDVMAAAVIGGISLKGGEGSLWGALAGVLFLAMINNALNLIDVSPYWVDAVRGLIILVALIIDAQKSRYKRRTVAQPAPARR